MKIDARLPVSQYLVQFQTRHGRPFSPLERFVLRAAHRSDTPVNAEQLQQTFQTHPRLIIEALVTLTQEGWLGVTADAEGFLITDAGIARLEGAERLIGHRVVSERPQRLILERLTGTLIRDSEVNLPNFTKLRDTGWDRALSIPTVVVQSRLPESAVVPLLDITDPHKRLERIERIDMVDQDVWLPVRIDTKMQTVEGLADVWVSRLTDPILEWARGVSAPADEAAHVMRGLPTQQPTIRVVTEPLPKVVHDPDDDLIVGPSMHQAYLSRAFASADSSILLASAYVSATRVEWLIPQIRVVLQRGVDVDLLWGYHAPPDALQRLRELATEGRRNRWSGELQLNATPSGSHMKLLVWDRAPNCFVACVGSFNWLASGEHVEVSAEVADAGTVAHAVGVVADVLSIRTLRTPERVELQWRRLAEALRVARQPSDMSPLGMDTESQAEDAPPVARVAGWLPPPNYDPEHVYGRLVLDTEHDVAFRRCGRAARRAFVVMSHQFGPAAISRLAVRAEEVMQGRSTIATTLLVGREQPEADPALMEQLQAVAKQALAEWTIHPTLHAKVLASDDTVVISSYNFLSADPNERATNGKELGVMLHSRRVVRRLRERLAQHGIVVPDPDRSDGE